jgi:dUTP pyrophosphatase
MQVAPPQYKLLLYVDKLEFDDSGEYGKICAGYEKSIREFNANQTTLHPDAGFDLYVPNTHVVEGIKSTMVSHHIKIAMYVRDTTVGVLQQPWRAVSYRMYPRSSFSKTSLTLANHVGIFDAGYRGAVLMALRNLSLAPYTITTGDRLMQICAPSLDPFMVERVYTVEGLNLMGETARGVKGFGSSGANLAEDLEGL